MTTDWEAVVSDLRLQGTVGIEEIDDSIAVHTKPDEAPRPRSVPFPVKELRESGLLWFVNNMILWPLGVALAVSIDSDGLEGDVGSYDSHMTLAQWEFPDGHRETIETTWDEERDIAKEPGQKHPFERLMAWLPGRIQSMPKEEGLAAVRRLGQVGLYEGALLTKPREVWTADGMEYEINWDVSRETPD